MADTAPATKKGLAEFRAEVRELIALQVERLNDLGRRLQQIERRLDLGPAA